MKGSRRLARLEKLLAASPCPDCQPGLAVLADAPAQPQHCPRCGRALHVIELLEEVVNCRGEVDPGA